MRNVRAAADHVEVQFLKPFDVIDKRGPCLPGDPNDDAAAGFVAPLEMARLRADMRTAAVVRWLPSEHPPAIVEKLPLSRRAVFCGEISRVDLDPVTGIYRAVLIGDIQAGWQGELRMPLLQRAAARTMQRNEAGFVVGMQELDGSRLSVVNFGATDMDQAEESARRLVARGLRAIREAI